MDFARVLPRLYTDDVRLVTLYATDPFDLIIPRCPTKLELLTHMRWVLKKHCNGRARTLIGYMKRASYARYIDEPCSSNRFRRKSDPYLLQFIAVLVNNGYAAVIRLLCDLGQRRLIIRATATHTWCALHPSVRRALRMRQLKP